MSAAPPPGQGSGWYLVEQLLTPAAKGPIWRWTGATFSIQITYRFGVTESLEGELMRRAVLLVGGVLLCGHVASAQTGWTPHYLLSPPPPALAVPTLPPPPPSQRIFPVYHWQFDVSYAYFRYYEVPFIIPNTNGFSTSLTYFFWRPFGVEGEFVGTYTTQSGKSARFSFVGGGPHYRYVYVGKFEPWIHVLVGHAHYNFQTPFGKKGAFAFEAGGGFDVRMNNWFSIRAEGDSIVTFFFNLYQVSPKIAGGAVLNF